ncbi:serine hydrolase [Pseudomonas sp. MPC6]|uniref:serine hydrolase domain-containing protein n=1 Tax=unclassified Pseudomonas TaxID=196821 RepID=UPI001110A645|nr:serine hydrolase [Pseudomonas sp. MPC6]QCY09456.1 class C beta-lactamase-related serine hydrolase [Pseudomonas sp. MPC6]
MRSHLTDPLMQGFPPPPEQQVTLANWQRAPYSRWAFQNVRRLVPTAEVSRGNHPPSVFEQAPRYLDDVPVTKMDGQVVPLQQLLCETSTDAFLVIHRGKIVTEQYFNGMAPSAQHLLMSVTKSVGSTLMGILVSQGLIDLDAPLPSYIPELKDSAYGDATVRQVLDMQIASNYDEYPEAPGGYSLRDLDQVTGWSPESGPGRPKSMYDLAQLLKKGDGDHGQRFSYDSINTDMLGWIMERVTGIALPELLSRELWSKLGAERDAYIGVDPSGSAILDGGLCATLRDMGRFGQMILQGGTFNDQQILPRAWIDDIRFNSDSAAWAKGYYAALFPEGGYRSQWWLPGNALQAMMAAGVFGQIVYIDPVAQLVGVKFSSHPEEVDGELYQNMARAFETIAAALEAGNEQ